MKRELIVTHDGAESAVVVEGPLESGRLRITIAGKAREVDAKQVRPGTWSLVVDGHNYLVDLDKRANLNGKVAASVGASEAVLLVEDAAHRRLAAAAPRAQARGETLRAPIAGKVVKVLVAVGDNVAPHTAVIVLEAMKMENELISERGGIVKVIHKQAGQAVDTGDTLVELESVPQRLLDVLLERKIIVCVGSGGVGKTTTAAALALAAARRGKKTLVLTIDPAKRLANSLGLTQLGHKVQEVDPALVGAGAPASGGKLYAMMLDQKQAFDEVVQRHAKDPAAVQRILANPVYSQISGSLAGAQEYAAMAKLHDFDAEGGYDTIIVDTPPTAHALDFLDAPRKLSEAIDSPAIEWFRKLQGGSGSGWSLVGKTGAFVMKRLAKFVGSQFIDDLGVFFTEFNDILGGFRKRAEETFALLRQPRVGFVLVASPEAMAVREALFFHERLVAAQMPFIGFVVNKVHPSLPIAADVAGVARALGARPNISALQLSGTTHTMAAQALLTAHGEIEVLALADRIAIGRLKQAGGQSLLIEVPLLRDDVHEVKNLIGLEQYLLV